MVEAEGSLSPFATDERPSSMQAKVLLNSASTLVNKIMRRVVHASEMCERSGF